MNNFIYELNECTLSSKEILLTDAIINKIHQQKLQNVIDNAQSVRAYYFTYQVNNSEISGYIAFNKEVIKKTPVIIYNRGGTGDFGIIKPGNIFTRIADIARMGYIVIGSNFPGNSLSEGLDEHGGESDMQSVIGLHHIIKRLSLCDENRIGMYGESRGGLVAYQCAQLLDWIKAYVTVGAVSNLRRSMSLRPEMKKIYANCFNIHDKNEINRRSAVRNISKFNLDSNISILHGACDDKVSPLDALELAKGLQENQINYSLHILAGGNHTLSNCEDELYKQISSWFSRYL